MQVALVVRLMDAEKTILAWTKLSVVARGDGCLYAIEPTMTLLMQQTGTPAFLSYHWADLNLEWRVELKSGLAPAGTSVTLTLPKHEPLIVVGKPPTDLPAVTVGSTVVAVPVAR